MKNTSTIVRLSTVALVGLVALAGVVLAQAAGARLESRTSSDCPGKIVCPLTGQEVCRDKCPTVDPNRPDCPGRVVCPLTGKLVCKDRCPLEKNGAAAGTQEAKVPPCCAKKG